MIVYKPVIVSYLPKESSFPHRHCLCSLMLILYKLDLNFFQNGVFFRAASGFTFWWAVSFFGFFTYLTIYIINEIYLLSIKRHFIHCLNHTSRPITLFLFLFECFNKGSSCLSRPFSKFSIILPYLSNIVLSF